MCLFLECALFGICPFPNVPISECALFGMCPFWHVPSYLACMSSFFASVIFFGGWIGLQYWAWCPGPMIPTTRKAQGNMSYLACMSSFFAWVIWLFFFSNVAENQPFGGLQSMKEWQRARLPFTLLGSGSEWPKDQTLILTMVSYLRK